uniref:Uncharacterized protein n=1 Tax=Arundo donax TaxID=35708 RepID=A0A0A9D0F5_ARUDO
MKKKQAQNILAMYHPIVFVGIVKNLLVLSSINSKESMY